MPFPTFRILVHNQIIHITILISTCITDQRLKFFSSLRFLFTYITVTKKKKSNISSILPCICKSWLCICIFTIINAKMMSKILDNISFEKCFLKTFNRIIFMIRGFTTELFNLSALILIFNHTIILTGILVPQYSSTLHFIWFFFTILSVR